MKNKPIVFALFCSTWIVFSRAAWGSAQVLVVDSTANTAEGTFVSFYVPDSRWTDTVSIGPSGTVVARYADLNYVIHAFLRHRDGSITTIDAPGALHYGTSPSDMSSSGMITGGFGDSNGSHGFIRSRDGDFTVLDGDSPGSLYPKAINPAGIVTGTLGTHGFVRDTEGVVTVFDVPGSFQTSPADINPDGVIVGTAQEGGATLGFIREPDGSFTVFGVPGAPYTDAVAINPDGVVTGSYYGTCGNHNCGFVRTPDGEISVFSAIEFPRTDTVPVAINPAGDIVGRFAGEAGMEVFVRHPDGTFDTYPFPSTFHARGADATGINEAGVISGGYEPDDGSPFRGFILIPGFRARQRGVLGGRDRSAGN